MKSISTTLKKTISLFITLMLLFNMGVFVSAQRSLDADLKWTENYENGSWIDATNADIFSSAAFEPGSEIIRYFKISNTGGLAFSYDLEFTADGNLGDLAEVIDVYYLGDVTKNVEIDEMNKLGTLKDVANVVSIANGKMLPSDLVKDGFETGEKNIAIALKMQDAASSEYMGASLENGFYVSLSTEECDFEYPLVDKFKVKLPESDFLYRVGNVNNVALGTLFEVVEGADIGNVNVSVTTLDSSSDASGTFIANSDWTKATIDFNGEGPVKVTITDDDYAKEVSLNLEVVTATNVTSYSGLGSRNSVLLNDITMSSNGSLYLSGGVTIYGNGFTFDVTEGKHGDTEKGNLSGNYVVGLVDSHLDNIKIVGSVYTQYGATAKADYNFPNVLSRGDSTITNSYISNCFAPVRVLDGTLEIKNTTLKGGNFANIDIREAKKVILDNVTTINQINSNDTAADGTEVVGLGVLVWYENRNPSIVEIKNGITQYNYLSKSQANACVDDSTVKSLISKMYSIDNIKYNDGTVDWVNTGILSATSAVGESHILGVDDYIGQSVTALNTTGYVRTQRPDAESISKVAPKWVGEQGAVLPIAEFDHDLNKVAQVEGSNEFCYYNSDYDQVFVSFDEGNSKTFNLNILEATKSGEQFPYTIKVDGAAYTNDTITFDQTKDYIIEYTFTDPYNYVYNEDGNVVKKDITYTKNLNVSVTAVPKAAKDAEFKFYGYSSISKTPAVKITDVKTATSSSGNIYVMPATTGTYVSSKTIDGITVNCPKVYVDFKNNTSDFNWLYPLFLGFDITDYADGGTGDAVTVVTHNTQATKPANFSIITADKPGSGDGWSSGAGGGKNGSEGKIGSGTYKNLYGWTSGAIGSDKDANSIYGEFSYKDNKGTVYYFCVEFYRAAHDCPSTCVTGDTLVTLSDGSQKRIDEITSEDELLVWDFYEGKYAAKTPAIIFDHGAANNTVIKLKFEDGRELKVVNMHQFFDVQENKFVTINEENVESYLNHEFIKMDGNSYSSVKLTDYEISKDRVEAYGIISAQHYNIITEGLLTTDFEAYDYGLFNYFEVGENLTFDAEKMNSDISEYGLYDYEDFKGYLTPELFDLFNVKYMKVSVGKGQYTYQDMLALVEKWIFNRDETILPQEPTPTPAEEPAQTEESDIAIINDDIIPNVVVTNEIIKSGSNTITAAKAEFDVALSDAQETEGGYVINADVATVSLTLKGVSNGYAVITVDGDEYYTASMEKGQTKDITIKNAKDKKVTVASFWGVHSETAVDVIDLGEFFVKSVEVTQTGAKAVIANTTKYDRTDVNVFIAVYDKDTKRLSLVNTAKVTIKGNEEYPISVEGLIPVNYEIKAFVWDDDLKPVE